ncbi:MAG: hypothetical protein ACI93R_003745 [Flavobacteriales bacterium]|jgi:hypothetical protein
MFIIYAHRANFIQAFARAFTLIVIIFSLSACIARLPQGVRLTSIGPSELVRGSHFKHRIVSKIAEQAVAKELQSLNVYIEGDGYSWLAPNKIAKDPSPEKILTLAMMAEDKGHTLFLGRPCYFQTSDKACHPGLWTNARYSLAVIESMETVVRNELERRQLKHIQFITHSGGSVIALALADRIEEVYKVIAFAPLLDIHAWTELHTYSPLDMSIDPLEIRPRNDTDYQFYTGTNDLNTPVKINRRYFERYGLKLNIIAKQKHHCCWLDFWQENHSKIQSQ